MPFLTEEYKSRKDNRFWWWRISGVQHDPLINWILDAEQNDLLAAWYEDTTKQKLIGECAPPLGSMLIGFIVGNSIERIVQLGHYSGYSTISIAACLKKMDRGHLYSIDLNERVTNYTQSWVERFKFDDYVTLRVGDSARLENVTDAISSLGGLPELLFIDSSHRYDHTLAELDLWFPSLKMNGFVFLHDASRAAREYDPDSGAVAGALEDWCRKNNAEYFVLNGGAATPARSHSDLVYRDGRGLGIIQKRESK